METALSWVSADADAVEANMVRSRYSALLAAVAVVLPLLMKTRKRRQRLL